MENRLPFCGRALSGTFELERRRPWRRSIMELVVFRRLGAVRLGVVQRADSRASWMIRDIKDRLAYVVFVIRFIQLMADTRMIRIGKTTWFAGLRNKSRIDSDAQDVLARRNDRLSVSAIENEVLPAQFEHIGIGPAVADALVA